MATVGVVRKVRMASVSLEELVGVTWLLEEATLEELAATLLEETAFEELDATELEETGAGSSSLGTWPLKLS